MEYTLLKDKPELQLRLSETRSNTQYLYISSQPATRCTGVQCDALHYNKMPPHCPTCLKVRGRFHHYPVHGYNMTKSYLFSSGWSGFQMTVKHNHMIALVLVLVAGFPIGTKNRVLVCVMPSSFQNNWCE